MPAGQARVALGLRLRDIRRDAGLTGTALAARERGWSPSKISKIERGSQTPTQEDLRAWCGHCRAPAELPGLAAAARDIETQLAGGRRALQTGTRHRQDTAGAVFQRARLFRIYEPAVIPGLLQTREYASAILHAVADFTRTPQDAEELAAGRLERQRILADADRRFQCLLAERALRTAVGGAGVMTAQLEHLIEASAMPRLRLGVIPADAPYRVPPSGGFWILDEELVQEETYAGELAVVRPEEIALYDRAFERLTALAVYGAEARQIIAERCRAVAPPGTSRAAD